MTCCWDDDGPDAAQERYNRLKDRLICKLTPDINGRQRPDQILPVEEMHGLAIWLYRGDSLEQAKHMDPSDARWLFHPTPWDNSDALPGPIGDLPCDLHRRCCKEMQQSPRQHAHGVGNILSASSTPSGGVSSQQYWELPLGQLPDHSNPPSGRNTCTSAAESTAPSHAGSGLAAHGKPASQTASSKSLSSASTTPGTQPMGTTRQHAADAKTARATAKIGRPLSASQTSGPLGVSSSILGRSVDHGQTAQDRAQDMGHEGGRSRGGCKPVASISEKRLKQTPGGYASRPRPRPSTDRQHASHSLVGYPMTHDPYSGGRFAQSGEDRSKLPGSSPWYKPRTRSRQESSAYQPDGRSFDVHGRFSPPSPAADGPSSGHQTSASQTSSLLQTACPDGVVFSPKENARRGEHDQHADQYEDTAKASAGNKGSAAIPDGYAARGGHSMKGVRTEGKGNKERLLTQRRASDAEAGSFNFQRTLKELSAGIGNDSKSSRSHGASSHPPNPKNGMPKWIQLLKDLH
ncbi:hypothetical protein WJX74_006541 [Apatococcus lobatus]|uniref:Uncharacterized protein n=1 Tax=Apatococcus lobatus TaxID=904363 RepID=A0AAW1QD53_9CHLO